MSPVKIKNHVSRNGFDLSRKVCFTAKFGQLLPVLTKMMYPGDKFKIDLTEFTRTLPVNSAAFTRMRHYFDFYFVPIRLLWRDWPSFITSMADTAKQATSIIDNRKVGTMSPFFTRDQIINYINAAGDHGPQGPGSNIQPVYLDGLGFLRSQNTKRLLSYLGYYNLGDKDLSLSHSDNVSLSPFPLLAYQKIYNDFFRYSQWEAEQSNTYNVDYLSGTDMQIPVEELIASNGMLASKEPNMFDLRYANYNKDMFLGVLPNRQYGAISTVDGKLSLSPTAPNAAVPFPLYFRKAGLSEQPINAGYMRPNIDTFNRKYNMYMPVSSNKGYNIGGVADQDANWQSYVDLGANYLDTTAPNEFVSSLKEQFVTSFSILQLRMSEAVQKFREIALSNNQDYKSQIEAQYGVKVSQIESGLCTYIGGISHDISVNEVVNTNLAADNTASILGKGLSSGTGKTIEYETNTYGILMCIYHATVLPDYNVCGYERDVMRVSYSDYPNPIFDKLGMEPVPQVLLTGKNLGLPLGIDDNDTDGIIPLGYAPRYYDLKTSYDILLGGFNSFQGGKLINWITPIDPTQLLPQYSGVHPNFERANYWSFKINPHIVDNLFNAKADDTLDSDPLLVTSFFDIKAVRNYDRNGLPY